MILAIRFDRVNLTCTVDDEGTDHPIAWYYNNIPRTSSGGVLLLDGVSITDGGWYTCAASTDDERYELDFLLVVGGEMMIISVYETSICPCPGNIMASVSSLRVNPYLNLR